MAPLSKWQGLPTEAINPSTLAIDKLSPAEIVELMLAEDRKMLAARRANHLRGGRHERPAWCARVR
jgi:hypothetical protein